MKHKTLADLLSDTELHRLIASHLGGTEANASDFAAHYKNLTKKLEVERFIVPIFGVQGSGKSTLLNALLFKHPVLPVEADETTCVPVEIMWSENPNGTARIIFQDASEERVPADEENLAAFIDNARNLGNKRGVDRVVLESNSELLQNGMVLVDLPGIGSMTKANVATTENYLKESVGIIFMLRTSPPITQSDSVAIQLQWPRLPYAFFIQNRWSNESKREATQGLEHNLRVLREIATKARVHLEPDGPTIHVVNAYTAWRSALDENSGLAKESGLDAAAEALRTGICEWPQRLREVIRETVQFDLSKAGESINARLDDLKKTREQLEIEIENDRQRFDSYMRKARETIDAEKVKAEVFRTETQTKINEARVLIQKNLRNVMRTKMKTGIVDGHRLETALHDEQNVAFDDIVENIHQDLMSFVEKLKAQFETIQNWEGSASFRPNTVRSDESFKFENHFSTLLGAGGGIAGLLAGPAVLALLVSNPVGWAVIAAGVVGGIGMNFFGSWLGTKGHDYFLDKRIEKAERQVFDAIAKFTTDISGQLERSIVGCIDGILSALDSWLLQQEITFLREKRQRMETFKAGDEEKQARAEFLQSELKQANWYQTQLASL